MDFRKSAGVRVPGAGAAGAAAASAIVVLLRGTKE